MALASHTQSHETGNKTEKTSSPMDAEIDNPRQAAQSESIPGSESSEENSSATDTEDNNTHQYPQSRLIPGSDSSEQENKKPPRKASYWNHLYLDTWFSEILAISFSLACFIAIVALLSSFDGKQSPQLAYGLTLNTIVSIQATACKSSLLFLVAESIGQLKWVWFFQRGKDSKKKPLQDIQSFDGASRGPLGSLTILFEHKGLSLPSLGAAITLLSLAFDPFIQQIIDYPLGEVTRESDLAVAKQAIFWYNGYGRFGTIFDKMISDSVNAGVWTDDFEVNPVCQSGNCTWPSFDSLGWCSQCEDVTASAVLVGCDNATIKIGNKTTQHTSCNITLPLGNPGMLQMTSELKGNLTKVSIPQYIVWTVNDHISQDRPSYVGVENPQFVLAYAEFDFPNNLLSSTGFDKGYIPFGHIRKATQCAVTACSRTYNISVSNGNTMIHTSAPNFGETFFHNSLSCWKKDKGAPVNLKNLRFDGWADASAMASCNWNNFRSFDFLEKLTGFVYYEFDYFQTFLDSSIGGTAGSDNIAQIASTGLDQVTTRIANSLTKLALNQSNFTVTGTISHTKTFVAVKWKWITLPAVVVFLSLVFLLTTILANSRQKQLALWKSSVLPFLYHGIDNDKVAVPDGKDVVTVSAMEMDAKGVEVRLEESERGRFLFR